MSLQEELLSFASSVGDMFRRRVAKTPNSLPFLDPDRAPQGPNQWSRYTWAESRVLVDQLAAGLLARGLAREQRVGIISSTRLEWILMDLAVACAAGATTTVYPNTAAGDVDFILGDSGTCIAVVEDASQLAKVNASPFLAKTIHTIVVIDASGVELNDRVISYTQLQRLGAELLDQNPGIVDEAIATTTSESTTRWGPRTRSASTTPVAAPAMS